MIDLGNTCVNNLMNKKWSLWLHDLKNIYLLYEAHFFFYYWGRILFYFISNIQNYS